MIECQTQTCIHTSYIGKLATHMFKNWPFWILVFSWSGAFVMKPRGSPSISAAAITCATARTDSTDARIFKVLTFCSVSTSVHFKRNGLAVHHSPTRSLTHSLTHSLIRLLCPLTQSLSHSLTSLPSKQRDHSVCASPP